MLKLVVSSAFKKELKKIKSVENRMALKLVLDSLLNEKPLDRKHKEHFLSGGYKDYKECHVKPDLLLVYRIVRSESALYVLHIGSHSYLFKC